MQLPGPTDIPERVLPALARQSVDFDHAGFTELVAGCLDGLGCMLGTRGRVYACAALGQGAPEATLVNLVGAGEVVRVPETGRFGTRWAQMAEALGLPVARLPTDTRRPVDPGPIETALRADWEHRIRGVLAVHVETSIGIRHDPPSPRAALDAARHPALLVVDAIASLASIPLEMDPCGIDLVVAGSQKKPVPAAGVSFVAAGPHALELARTGGPPRRYRDGWGRAGAESHERSSGTPPVSMIFALRQALDTPGEEGRPAVVVPDARLVGAVRAVVARWSGSGAIDFHCLNPDARADAVTRLAFASGIEPDRQREWARDRYGVAGGGGSRPVRRRPLRTGYPGDRDDAMVPGVPGVLALRESRVPYGQGGVEAALGALARR